MAAGVNVRVVLEPSPGLEHALASLQDPGIAVPIARALRRSAFRVQELAAQKFIIRSGPPGVVDPIRVTSRTGTLRRSIRANLGELPRAAEVGTDLLYGAVHELGSRRRRIRQRPFLTPAADLAAARDMPRYFEEELFRATAPEGQKK